MFMFIENAIMHALHEKLENSTFCLPTYKKWFTLHREIPKNIYILHSTYVFYHAMKPKCISLLTY